MLSFSFASRAFCKVLSKITDIFTKLSLPKTSYVRRTSFKQLISEHSSIDMKNMFEMRKKPGIHFHLPLLNSMTHIPFTYSLNSTSDLLYSQFSVRTAVEKLLNQALRVTTVIFWPHVLQRQHAPTAFHVYHIHQNHRVFSKTAKRTSLNIFQA